MWSIQCLGTLCLVLLCVHSTSRCLLGFKVAMKSSTSDFFLWTLCGLEASSSHRLMYGKVRGELSGKWTMSCILLAWSWLPG